MSASSADREQHYRRSFCEEDDVAGGQRSLAAALIGERRDEMVWKSELLSSQA